MADEPKPDAQDLNPKPSGDPPPNLGGDPPKDPPAGDPPPDDVVYDVKPGENSPLDPKGDVEKIVAFAKAHKLSNEQAKALLSETEKIGAGVVTRAREAAEQQLAQKQSEWLEELKADPELGGANFPATRANLDRVMQRFAPKTEKGDTRGDQVRKFMDATAYGNNPAVVWFVNAIGKALAPDKPPNGDATNGEVKPELNKLQRATKSFFGPKQPTQ